MTIPTPLPLFVTDQKGAKAADGVVPALDANGNPVVAEGLVIMKRLTSDTDVLTSLGADATGVVPPTGAIGVRGWLSAIYARLTGTLAVADASAEAGLVAIANNTAATATGQAAANALLTTIANNGATPPTAAGQTAANASLASILAKLGTTLATADAGNAAFQGVVAIMPNTPVAAQRSLGFICTAAGNVTLTLADTSTITIAIAVSPQFQSLPFAVTNVALGSGTAGSFWNLK